ncbi:MAG: 3-deoxy-D-manno-octulosonic acid transferase [Thermodesulfovibrio aggregans]|uniref:3-deoxy-D-manno-octulosonic acid transferase n=2 Tax=Thermodesulfovibrio TaxID=28261 RepID=A0A2J6WI19_9BACT|nr:MAG: 3-deoxy-D-manno-octulosonic acid transferase [Thermodesulfovibrio aggregans]
MQATFLIYSFLYLVALMFLLPFEYFKRPVSLRKRWIREKFGFFKKNDKIEAFKPKILIHAVSVGEVVAVSRMIKELSSKYEIILSTITDTGQKIAQDRFKNHNVKVIYIPFDIPFAINKTLRHFKPVALILTETELWPNLIRISSKKIPVILVNGRMSDKSFNGYSKIKFFIKSLLKRLTLLCVQEERYKERFLNIGAEEQKIHVTGNMKFDIELREIHFPWENAIEQPVILAGSTHEPEEEIILDAFLKLNITGTLIIAPRHPERFEVVETLIKRKIAESSKEISFSKLSEMPSVFSVKPLAYVVLVDQMGILGSLYRICDIAIIGGSFIAHGGQNPLEPAYWRKPIVCGPFMHNFPFIEEFLNHKACIMIDKASLPEILKELAENSELRQTIGNRAYQLFLNKSGATEKTLRLIEKVIP